jgi:hypothetical protein
MAFVLAAFVGSLAMLFMVGFMAALCRESTRTQNTANLAADFPKRKLDGQVRITVRARSSMAADSAMKTAGAGWDAPGEDV